MVAFAPRLLLLAAALAALGAPAAAQLRRRSRHPDLPLNEGFAGVSWFLYSSTQKLS